MLFFRDKGEPEVDPEEAFFNAVETSKPTQIKTLTYYTEEGKDSFNGTFETVINGNDFEFKYSYSEVATLDNIKSPDATLDGNIVTFSGTVYYENGKYSTDRETWFTEAPAVTDKAPKLNLNREKLGEYEMNDVKTSLTATLTPEAAAEVLGIVIDADSDIVITVKTNGTYLTRLSVTYTKGTASCRIDTSYS